MPTCSEMPARTSLSPTRRRYVRLRRRLGWSNDVLAPGSSQLSATMRSQAKRNNWLDVSRNGARCVGVARYRRLNHPEVAVPERMQAERDGVSLVVQVSLAALPGKARAVTSPANLSLCRWRAERPHHSTSGPQGLHCEIGC